MADLRASLSVDLIGNLAARSKSYGRALGQFTHDGERNMNRMARASRVLGRGLDKLGNRYTALLSGAAAYKTIGNLITLENRMVDLRRAANLSAEATDKLQEALFKAANAKEVRLDVSKLVAGVQEVQDRAGVLFQTEDELRVLGIAMRATGGDARYMGQIVANALTNLKIKGADDLLAYLDMVSAQGKMARLRLDEIAAVSPTVTGAYAVSNRIGVQAGQEAMALAQVARSNVSSAEESATAVKAIMNQLLDPTVRKKIKSMGIQIMDPEDEKRMRAVPDILKEVVAAAKGDAVKLRQLFTSQESAPIVNALATSFNQTGGFKLLDDLLAVKADGKQLVKDAQIGAATMSASLNSWSTAWGRFADKRLSGPLKKSADMLNTLTPEQQQTAFGVAAGGALAVGGLLLGRKMGLFGRGKGKGGLGAALGGAAGATPVIVTNWPGSMGMGAGSGLTRRGSAARGLGRGGGAAASGLRAMGGRSMKLLGKVAGRAALPLAVLMSGIDFAQAASEGDTKGMAGAGGGLAGSLAGGAAGAAIGSVVPVIGTAIGGIVGGIAGYFGGDSLGRMIADMIGGDEKIKAGGAGPAGATGDKTKGELVVRLENFPANTRVKATASSNTDLTVDQGLTMAEVR